ncbi:vitelline membrane outer layer protein 1-like [Varanus komodoensis]|uniref:vitelline membrane outer layer protein 1-like n=1 Tax=Varanus komodoensis TaxID=61221 RepID=UPI001CF7AF53|nr:vitelline membrane outer layer protein 1-like [Varanus komodoensis]
MDFSISSVFFLIISHYAWDVEGQRYNTTFITVPNGGRWGTWGPVQFCPRPRGYAHGFSLKIQTFLGPGTRFDDTAMNGIRLYCENGAVIESAVAPWGLWTKPKFCHKGYGPLRAFSMRVEPDQGSGDDTAVNDVQFICGEKHKLFGGGLNWGTFDKWSKACPDGYVCGLQTKVQEDQGEGDNTGLNDIKLFCCSG